MSVGYKKCRRPLASLHVTVVKMYYMNTDRDNFHDWARDKPDSTSFSALQQSDMRPYRLQPQIRWGRLGFYLVLAIAAGAGVKYFL
jgi:hypothetical protein